MDDNHKHITFEDIERANAGLKTLTITRWDSKRNCNVSKDYIEVNQKIKAFRRLYPEGTISTEILQLEGGYCAIKATVLNEAGAILATGHASEREDTNQINKTNLIENCETSAIGRALLMCGCGIEATFEADPGAAAPVPEAAPVPVNQEPKKPATKKAAPKPKAAQENTAAAFNNFMCEECGAPIVDNAKATAQEIAARSKKQFNKCLCWGCAIAKTKAAAALKAAQEEAKRKAAEAAAAAAGEDEEPVKLPFPV